MNKILLGDCRELANNIEDNSISLLASDPPYGISSETIIRRKRNPAKYKANKDNNYNFGEWDKFDTTQDFMTFTYNWLDLYVPKIKSGGIIASFFDRDKINFISHYLQTKYGFKTKSYQAWIKCNPVPQARMVKPSNGWEMFGIWQKPDYKDLTYNWFLGQENDYYFIPIVSGKERFEHPTQKPLEIFINLVSRWTKENDLVFDPFAGSGTTLVAAKLLGRNYMGFEINDKYVKFAEERLERAKLYCATDTDIKVNNLLLNIREKIKNYEKRQNNKYKMVEGGVDELFE